MAYTNTNPLVSLQENSNRHINSLFISEKTRFHGTKIRVSTQQERGLFCHFLLILRAKIGGFPLYLFVPQVMSPRHRKTDVSYIRWQWYFICVGT